MTELPTGELHRILSDAVLFAGKDGTLPMLNQVRLEATGTDLVAIATDRFMIGVSRTPFESEPWGMGLRLEQVELVRHFTRKRRCRPGFVQVNPTPKLVKLNLDLSTGDSLGVPAYTVGEFPSWRQLFTDPKPDDQVGAIAFNPAYMAKFGKVDGGRGGHMYMRFTKPSRPCQVHIGEHFVGLIMPVRLPSGSLVTTTLPDWLKALKK